MPTCAVQGCSASTGSFHRFPKNPETRMEWVRQINHEDFVLSFDTRVCDRHFSDSDWRIPPRLYNDIPVDIRPLRRLIVGAIPSLHLKPAAGWVKCQQSRRQKKKRPNFDDQNFWNKDPRSDKLIPTRNELIEISAKIPTKDQTQSPTPKIKDDKEPPTLTTRGDHSDEDLLATLHDFQRKGHLCDVTLQASGGSEEIEMSAHAGVLAAASSELEKQLTRCERGTYHIILPFTSEEITPFVDFVYTGTNNSTDFASWKILNKFCDNIVSNTTSHASKIVSKLHQFGEKGLFCNMACYAISGDIEPCHSFLMAAKWNFLSDNIKNDSIVYLKVSAAADLQDIEAGPFYVQNESPMDNTSSRHLSTDDTSDIYTVQNTDGDNNHSDTKIVLSNQNCIDTDLHISDEKPFLCTFCNIRFTSESSLKAHQLIHVVEKTYLCDICSKSFSTKERLNKHELSHSGLKLHSCPICQAEFERSSNLKKHLQVHSDHKPHQCGVCQKRFAQLGNLKSHERTHTGERPYQCETCSKTFTESGSLKRHQRTHSGDKPYECEICHQRFTHLTNARSHQQTHTGVRNFSCQICSKQFARLQHLKRHETTHTEDKPHECDICHEQFSSLANVRSHKKTHAGVRQFKCDICSKQFIRLHHLQRHQKIHAAGGSENAQSEK